MNAETLKNAISRSPHSPEFKAQFLDKAEQATTSEERVKVYEDFLAATGGAIKSYGGKVPDNFQVK